MKTKTQKAAYIDESHPQHNLWLLKQEAHRQLKGWNKAIAYERIRLMTGKAHISHLSEQELRKVNKMLRRGNARKITSF